MVRQRVLIVFLLLALWAGLVSTAQNISRAAAATPEPTPTEGPDRKVTLNVDYTAQVWWVIRWKDNKILCNVPVEHEGLPAAEEIKAACEPKVYTEWKNTKPCAEAEGNVQACSGVYLYDGGTRKATREVTIDLPSPAVWVSISNCADVPTSNRCDRLPSLLFTGEEPLPNEMIVSINGTINGDSFSCMGSTCEVPLPATGTQGVPVEFWADSSFGDTTEHYSAMVRVVPWGDFAAPEGETDSERLWYVDVLSDQWRGAPAASCSQIWESFPDLNGPPDWLTTPAQIEDLQSSEPYYYLAGSLIQSGEVDASSCPNNGLDAPGVANACGLTAARPAVVDWQNRFDAQIVQAADETGVPANLIKRIFSRESQFWPGIFKTFKEAGLGQMTSNGADTVFLWNPQFFEEFCPLIFDKSNCAKGFKSLSKNEQAILRGALVTKVNASCPDCPTGIDLSQVNFSIQVFAESLIANCQQAGQVVYNTYRESPGQVSSYVDLWRFTLVNYNAGSGCLSEAVQQTYKDRSPLDWENISANLDESCQGAAAYVDDITAPNQPGPTPTAAAPTGGLPTPGGTPQPGRTPTPTPTTAGGYPPPSPTQPYPAQPTYSPYP